MEPGKTSFFQALGVPTKIARGTIEITTDLKLVEKDAKVGASEATLLNMLNISPFSYGMKVEQVYEDGQTFPPDVLDIEESQLLKGLTTAITTIATISLATNYPTLPSIMHSLVNGYKKVLSVAIETEYSWPEIEELKDRIANPDAYASAAPAAAAGGAAAAADEPAAAAEEEEKEEEESGDEGEFAVAYSWYWVSATADISQVSVVCSTKYRSPSDQIPLLRYLRHFAHDPHEKHFGYDSTTDRPTRQGGSSETDKTIEDQLNDSLPKDPASIVSAITNFDPSLLRHRLDLTSPQAQSHVFRTGKLIRSPFSSLQPIPTLE
jgi:hypothetical protein